MAECISIVGIAAPLHAVMLGVERLEEIPDPECRHVARVVVPGLFVWNAPREREYASPLMEWEIAGKVYRGYVPVTFMGRGEPDTHAMLVALRKMIETSRNADQQ